MKRSFKSVLGVTLLEIMLVLAIAAMIVVMSIRYYQTASLNQKVAAAMDSITAVVAASESYMSATSTVPTNASNVTPYLPGSVMPNSPWTGVLVIAKGSGTGEYTITVPNVPAAACTPLMNLVKTNPKMSQTAPTCSAGAGLVVTVSP